MNNCKRTIAVVLLLSLMSSLVNTQGLGSCAPGAACVDCFDWCPSQTHHCSLGGYIQEACRKSCNSCVPAECLELNCNQRCIQPTANSPAKCACLEGYELDQDGRTCQDIDECARNASICDNPNKASFCRNIPGNYSCVSCTGADNNQQTFGYYRSTKCCLRSQNKKCGQSTSNGRIIGGLDSPIGRWPWQAYIRIGSNLCGGTILSKDYLLTAAHCVVNLVNDPSGIYILLGANDINDATSVHRQTFTPTKIILHPNYNFPDNDIAIIKLDRSAILSLFVHPICLPGGEEPRTGEICYATGYGQLSEGGAASSILQEVDLPIVDSSVCERAYENRTNDVHPNIHLCAGYTEGLKDSCKGDSGGPLVCQRCKNCNWYIAGVTSFGRGCARAGFFGVYTRVARFEQWIAQNIDEEVSTSHQECVKPTWHEWGPWTNCSVPCGVGMRSRARYCLNGKAGDPGCIGLENEESSCSAPPCQEPFWSAWSIATCSKTCGNGTLTRSRSCVNGKIGDEGCATGQDISTKPCNAFPCPTWNNWQTWSECSVTCGNGQRRSIRTCNSYDVVGNECTGENSRVQDCTQACWSEYENDGECSKTCGGGIQISTRRCLFGEIGAQGCVGSAVRETECNTNTCPTGVWSEWKNDGTCSVTCGGGTREQSRTCINGIVGEPGCIGDVSRTRSCETNSCPAKWGQWGAYSQCDKTCGGGNQIRSRECEGGDVGEGNCVGDETESRQCNTQSCGTGGNTNCPGLVNIQPESLCCQYTRDGYCTTFSDFMDTNCALACCRLNYGLTCSEQNSCTEHPLCPNYKLHCFNPNISQNCPKTCGKCQ